MRKIPVTKLLEAGDVLLNGPSSATWGAFESAMSEFYIAPDYDKPNANLLEVLDLVATLPPERLGLVRWAAGLSIAQTSALRLALRAAYEDAREVKDAAMAEAIAALVSGCESALSGGEGGAKCPECQGQGYHEVEHVSETERVLDTEKCGTCDGTGEGRKTCPECHGAGKVKRLEGSGSVRVVKYDPCPKCAEGESGAKEEVPACTSNGCRSCQYNGGCDQEDEQQAPHPMWGAVANAVVTPEPTILPAGTTQTHTSACVDGCACRAADATGKLDCQTCSWGFPMYDEQWRALPGRVWCRHQYEYDRALGLAAKAQQPEKRILPAGKPPPFLRVGMVMRERQDWRIVALTSENVWIDAVNAPVQMLMDRETVGAWPLAEPFTVEGES